MDRTVIEATATICAWLKFHRVVLYGGEKEIPDKICRMCGEELMVYSQCFYCKRAIQQICIRCGRRTIERIHLDCLPTVGGLPAETAKIAIT